MVPICMPPWNLLRINLTMEGKRKYVTVEFDEEEINLEELMGGEDEDEAMEVDTQPMHAAKKLPTYITLQKGKVKVPKDLDETKSSL